MISGPANFNTNFEDLIVSKLDVFVGRICFNALLSSGVRASKWPLALCWLMQMEQLLEAEQSQKLNLW